MHLQPSTSLFCHVPSTIEAGWLCFGSSSRHFYFQPIKSSLQSAALLLLIINNNIIYHVFRRRRSIWALCRHARRTRGWVTTWWHGRTKGGCWYDEIVWDFGCKFNVVIMIWCHFLYVLFVVDVVWWQWCWWWHKPCVVFRTMLFQSVGWYHFRTCSRTWETLSLLA